ncbi:dTDP-4-dehydrorhamnose reductase [Methanosarcina sp. MSH10X1]|uniref:dTDP-4-dehydrorhamnose reductase n=1 Tax=Methanosarcina sp. MSH10X1 TaxID=2507075 RepID=UPI000FFBB8BE|nr:dTDP-4-dehydrorhamnose reductase [Methanosarcina sp. MSH10X1]RXA21947.1 dTDP-4-dehydrorhamnose reductase [Methanosarcina sp. MSH10X1]
MVVGTIKTLIIGTSGMLGSDLCKVFPDAVKLTHRDLDIKNREQVIESILEIKPDIVINAAAYTDVDGCEDNKELAFQTNGYGPGYIAEGCAKVSAKFVHFSTDYVFDGSKKEYLETDVPDPINVYGHSKLLGEKEIIEKMHDYMIVRISWLFGVHGKNFVETVLRLSREIDTVKVVNDQFGKPTYALDLATKIKEIIELNPGIYHITNDGICSWYEFASSIIDNTVPCTSEEFPRKAKRPKYSVLVNTKTEPMRHWNEALKEYLKERNA